jgi:hypothetical protein
MILEGVNHNKNTQENNKSSTVKAEVVSGSAGGKHRRTMNPAKQSTAIILDARDITL